MFSFNCSRTGVCYCKVANEHWDGHRGLLLWDHIAAVRLCTLVCYWGVLHSFCSVGISSVDTLGPVGIDLHDAVGIDVNNAVRGGLAPIILLPLALLSFVWLASILFKLKHTEVFFKELRKKRVRRRGEKKLPQSQSTHNFMEVPVWTGFVFGSGSKSKRSFGFANGLHCPSKEGSLQPWG